MAAEMPAGCRFSQLLIGGLQACEQHSSVKLEPLLQPVCKVGFLDVVSKFDKVRMLPDHSGERGVIRPMSVCLDEAEDACIRCGGLGSQEVGLVPQQARKSSKIFSYQGVDVLMRVGEHPLRQDTQAFRKLFNKIQAQLQKLICQDCIMSSADIFCPSRYRSPQDISDRAPIAFKPQSAEH